MDGFEPTRRIRGAGRDAARATCTQSSARGAAPAAGGAGDVNLARPPFAVVDGLDPVEVADEIVSCFERIAARPDRVAAAFALSASSAGIDRAHPLHRAAVAIASDVDRGIGAGVAHGYHNARHFLEVVLSANYLARMYRLVPERQLRVLVAALIHDFHHDGSRSGEAPFRLEALSASRAARYFRDAGVHPVLREQLHALVLATEPLAGAPYARACLARHLRGSAAPAAAPVPERLERALRDPELALEAVLLAEADVLPSLGFTVAHGELEQDWLAAEWGVTLGAADKLAFIERVAPSIEIAAFFAPNIERLRQAFRRQIDAGG